MMKYSPTMLAIMGAKQLFFDDLIIETVNEITRTFHRPVKVEAPVIGDAMPWEQVPYFSGGTHAVFADPEDGLLKCLYNDFRLDRDHWKRTGSLTVENHIMTVNYAQSEDGLAWERTGLGLRMEGGHDTNIVFGDGTVEDGAVWAFCPVLNPHETDPARRFRTLYFNWSKEGMRQHVAFSPDAIHWTRSDQRPSFGGQEGGGAGDVIVTHYKPATRQYVASVRHERMSDVHLNPGNPRGDGGYLAFEPHYPLDFAKVPKRMVWQIESGDFFNWSEPHLILAPQDGFDNLDDEFYGMCQHPTGDITLGFLNVFQKANNTMQVQLVYSRDGHAWHRLNRGQPFLSPGPAGSWDRCMVTVMSRPVVRGDELFIFHGGSKSHHDWWMSGPVEGLDAPEVHDMKQVGYGLGLAKLRLDGFVSLDTSPVREGIMVTRPFISDGEELIINADVAPGGYVQVEVVDGADHPVPGCARNECDAFTGDSVRHVVTWKGKKTIGKGQGVGAVHAGEFNHFRKLRFFMRKARLYSFQIDAPGEAERKAAFPGMGWRTEG
jgi:hypothetical protein